MDLKITNRRALVCGATKGLGFAVAQSLLSEGAAVTVLGRRPEALEAACRSLKEETGKSCEAVVLDLSRSSEVEAWLSGPGRILMGQIDILINNTGGPSPSAAVDTSLESWRQGFDSLFLSACRMTQAAIPGMRSRKWGRVITITSIAVVEPIDHLAVSASMRAAVTSFSKLLATEVAADGVTVNTILPGIIHTDRINSLRAAKAQRDGTTFEAEMARATREIPAKRMGRPEELGDLAAFIASDRASFLTGSAICLDGGMRKSWG